jgi:hypothetical protein
MAIYNVGMATIEEIENAVRSLSEEDRVKLVDRLSDLLSDVWDLQIERNVAAGHLDHLISEAEQEIKAGHTAPLDEVLDNRQIS